MNEACIVSHLHRIPWIGSFHSSSHPTATSGLWFQVPAFKSWEVVCTVFVWGGESPLTQICYECTLVSLLVLAPLRFFVFNLSLVCSQLLRRPMNTGQWAQRLSFSRYALECCCAGHRKTCLCHYNRYNCLNMFSIDIKSLCLPNYVVKLLGRLCFRWMGYVVWGVSWAPYRQGRPTNEHIYDYLLVIPFFLELFVELDGSGSTLNATAEPLYNKCWSKETWSALAT